MAENLAHWANPRAMPEATSSKSDGLDKNRQNRYSIKAKNKATSIKIKEDKCVHVFVCLDATWDLLVDSDYNPESFQYNFHHKSSKHTIKTGGSIELFGKTPQDIDDKWWTTE